MAMASITNELRKYVKLCLPHYIRTELLSIADCIDAAHCAALEKLAASVGDDRDGWIELPRDADGVPICVGDDMESVNAAHMHGPVEYIALTESGWEVDGEPPEILRHHRTDTWERIIRDAIGEGMARQRNNDSGERCDRANPMNNDVLVARCKALAGGENS